MLDSLLFAFGLRVDLPTSFAAHVGRVTSAHCCAMVRAAKPRALLIDVSGTLLIGNQALPGAVEAVQKIQCANVPRLFVTNTTKESVSALSSRLARIGFPIDKSDLFSSLAAAKYLLQQRDLRPMLLLEEEALEDFADVPTDDPNCVLVGLAPSRFNYATLTAAFRLLKSQRAPLIAIHKARYMATPDSALSLGPGCFVAGLEYSAEVQAEVVGKPEPSFFLAALDYLNQQARCSLRPEGMTGHCSLLRHADAFLLTAVFACRRMGGAEVVMIGDDVRDDVLGAIKAGFQGCLVKTGKYCIGDEHPGMMLFDSFADAVRSFL